LLSSLFIIPFFILLPKKQACTSYYKNTKKSLFLQIPTTTISADANLRLQPVELTACRKTQKTLKGGIAVFIYAYIIMTQ
jgi:hypothetical protein